MEEKKLTDEEILKALKNCKKNNCIDCPYLIDEHNCNANTLLSNILDLIRRLQSENESLKKQIDELPKPGKKILANKVYSNSTLKKWSKEELIEQIRILEHNWSCAEESLNNSAKNSDEIFAEQKDEIEELKQAISGYVADQEVWISGYQGIQAENENLKADIELLTKVLGSSKRKTKILDLQREIEQLTEENNNLVSCLSCERVVNRQSKAMLDNFHECNKSLLKENAELQKQVDKLKEERENMQAEILRFEDMKFTQEHCDLYKENEWLKECLQQAVKDTAKEILIPLIGCEKQIDPLQTGIRWSVLKGFCRKFGVEVE